MSAIYLFFGNPCDDWAQETVEGIAINHGVSMERAAFLRFKNLIDSLSVRDDEDQSDIDYGFGLAYERFVYAPKLEVRQFSENGTKYPKIVLAKNYVIHKKTGTRMPITADVLDIFGNDFESHYGIEYLRHQWTGKLKWLNSRQLSLNLGCS